MGMLRENTVRRLAAVAALLALAGAVLLGVTALRLSRHEAAFRRESSARRLAGEVGLAAERGDEALAELEQRLHRQVVRISFTPRGVREAAVREPFFRSVWIAGPGDAPPDAGPWFAVPGQGGERLIVELEPLLLRAVLRAVLPPLLPGGGRLELLDASGQVIGALGDGRSVTGNPPVVLMNSNHPWAQGCAFRAYAPLHEPGGGIALGSGIAALLLVVSGGALLALVLVRRELQLASRKSRVVSQLSHELKTPLTNIRMYSELLRTRSGIEPEKRTRYLEIIDAEAGRMARLVGDLLDCDRPARHGLCPGELILAQVVRTAAERFAAAAERLGVEFRIDLDETLLVFADREALDRVIGNLIDNALKYASGGRRVEFSAEPEPERGRLLLHVRDHGPGIPRRERRRVFRRFYRCDDRLSSGIPGAGLGLAIARTLMWAQQGDLKLADSASGADFVVVLPLAGAH